MSDRKIRTYNRKYLRHDRPTDVIAFPMNEGRHLGDILISLDTAARQAKAEGHSTLREIKILAIHGLLHLVGYRDRLKKDRDRMWSKTTELLQRVESL